MVKMMRTAAHAEDGEGLAHRQPGGRGSHEDVVQVDDQMSLER
jgi:hypothetical protein